MNIRLATVDDIAAILSVVNAAYRPTDDAGWTHENALLAGARIDRPQLLQMLLQPDTAMLLAEHAPHDVIATVYLERTGSDAYIGMLSVSPRQQAQGLGKAMLAAAERHALAQWRPRRFVMSVLSRRTELIEFYLRRGYARSGKVIEFPHAANVGTPKVADLTLDELEKNAVASPTA